MAATKPDYGIDAPGVIRNLALIGIAGTVAFLISPPFIHLGNVAISRVTFGLTGGFCLVEAVLMLLYSKWGKFRHRDKLLAQIAWSGNEQVLDVGTGRGLLLIGAAKRLTSGNAVGIDVWSTKDLSGNAQLATTNNIAVEGVACKCTLETQGAQHMTFPDATFDVVLSNLCIHNIPSRGDRDRACAEIARVLKPGGHAIISDFKNITQYSNSFRQSGLAIKRTMINPLSFPPLRTVVAVKG